MSMRSRILALLKERGEMTIPELASELDVPPPEAVFWIMGMSKYNLVEESREPDEDGYFRYAAARDGVEP